MCWDLRDLFSVGDLIHTDAGVFVPQPEGMDDEEFSKQYTKMYPEGNLLFEVTALLTEDSCARFIHGNGNMMSLSRRIVVPRFDLFNTLYEDLETETDRQVYKVLGTNMTTLVVYSSLSPEKAHEAFMDLIREADCEEYIKDTDFNMSTQVQGISLSVYNKSCLCITGVLLLLLIVVTIIEIIRNVSHSEKKYAAHFMLGASQTEFFFGCVKNSWLAAVTAGFTTALFYTFWFSRTDNITFRIGSSLPARSVYWILAVSVLIYLCFTSLVAMLRLSRTDLSKVIKEKL